MTQTSFLNGILASFSIKATCIDFAEHNNSDTYDIKLSGNGRIRDLEKYLSEISLALKATVANLHILADRGILRLEIPKPERREPIDLFSLGRLPELTDDMRCLVGATEDDQPFYIAIGGAPHLLIGGTSGSGKSVLLHNLIANLIGRTELYLFDPKHIEFAPYEGISSVSIAYEYEECLDTLLNLYDEMNTRYMLMREGVIFHPSVIIIDEFSDLILQDESKGFHRLLCQLAQKGRACQYHIILSSQRPDAKTIDGAIKANFPIRIACRTISGTDSRVILDQVGAEDLLGRGDTLIKTEKGLTRFQSAYTTPSKVKDYIARQYNL